jgi:hypothetical protein
MRPAHEKTLQTVQVRASQMTWNNLCCRKTSDVVSRVPIQRSSNHEYQVVGYRDYVPAGLPGFGEWLGEFWGGAGSSARGGGGTVSVFFDSSIEQYRPVCL